MNKLEIITLAGRPGSGKSSTAKKVASALNYAHFSSGDAFREAAAQMGIDVLQANLSAENKDDDHLLDRLVDGRLRELGETQNQLVIDSRTAWHWIPGSFKVFLDLDLVAGAERVISDKNTRLDANEQISDDPTEYAAKLKERLDSENRRYKAMYGIDPYDMSNYDLVIDTGSNPLDDVIELVLKGYDKWKQEKV